MSLTHTVTVLPVNLSFECSEEETLLEAAIRRGFALPYGCRKGNCGTCKAQVLDGEVDLDVESSAGLTDFEVSQGLTLLCSAYPLGDTTVELDGLDAADLDAVEPVGEYRGKVLAVRRLTHDLRSLEITLDRPLRFRSGQFVELNPDGTDVWRSYSMANPASQGDRLQFMVKLIPGGRFSERLEQMVPGQPIGVRGPYGAFWVRNHARPLLMVGGGAGLAPLWSMLQDLAERRDPRPVRLFYGARTSADLFHLGEIDRLGGQLADFDFVVALSEEDAGPAPGAERGLVTEVLERQVGRAAADHDAYLCGPPPMIDAALALLERHGLVERASVFYDRFTAS